MVDEQKDPFEHTRMTLGEHLSELRRRLFRGLLALFVAFAVGWYFYEEAGEAFLWPMRQAVERVNAEQLLKYEKKLVDEPGHARSEYFQSDDPADKRLRPELVITTRMVATAPGEQFAYALKVSTILAFAFGAPVLLWQMWGFIAAGLYPRERRMVFLHFPLSLGLFLIGVAFGFFVMMPFAFYFLITTFPPEKIEFLPSLESYVSLLTSLTLILGGVFQLPLVMFALVKLDLVPRSTFVRYRRHFIVATFVLAGLLTPPDPYTQSMMAIPMLLLYEAALFATRFVDKREPEKKA
jgi:sec-independent protein translocase protein TatC